MAAIYWRGDERTGSWWIKTYHPLIRQLVRQSLDTIEKPRAELICKRVELELDLRRPGVVDVQVPPKLAGALGLHPDGLALDYPASPLDSAAADSPLIEEVLGEFMAFIEVENAPAHAKNKIAYLKKFFGIKSMGLGDGVKGVFTGSTLADVRVVEVRKLIDSLPVGKKTKKHHREAFHAMFEFAMKYSYFIPVNFRYPNPMSALPTYHEKNRRIVFLTKAEVDALLEILKPSPSVRIAVALMIFGGLRRAEVLWLTKACISPDLKFMSIINNADEEKDLESRLKTGELPVPIVPALKVMLEDYLSTLESEWLVPSPTGLQWHGDNFGDKHRGLLRADDIAHTCLHYRHTFATDRAREGWSLFRISKAMGNSIAVCEEYYAAFIDPLLA